MTRCFKTWVVKRTEANPNTSTYESCMSDFGGLWLVLCDSVVCWRRCTRLKVTVSWWTPVTADQSTAALSSFPHHSSHLIFQLRLPPRAAHEQLPGTRGLVRPWSARPWRPEEGLSLAVADSPSTWSNLTPSTMWLTSSEHWLRSRRSTASSSRS